MKKKSELIELSRSSYNRLEKILNNIKTSGTDEILSEDDIILAIECFEGKILSIDDSDLVMNRLKEILYIDHVWNRYRSNTVRKKELIFALRDIIGLYKRVKESYSNN